MLEVREAAKRYGALTVVRDVSFTAGPGEVVGLLGPNGSGKSTTVKMLVGLLQPTSGRVLYQGRNVHDEPRWYKQHLGYVPEEADLYTHLTAAEHLRLIGRMHGLREAALESKIQRFLTLFGLDTDYHTPLAAFSKGMRQKVLLSAALLHNPKIIILDEPTSGLDAATALALREMIANLASDGRIVICTSHEIETIEKISTRVMVMRSGEIVANDSVSSLRAMMSASSLEDVFSQLTYDPRARSAAAEFLEIVRR